MVQLETPLSPLMLKFQRKTISFQSLFVVVQLKSKKAMKIP